MKKAIVLAFVTVVTSPPAWAQNWGRSGYPRDGVCFFKEPNFGGDYFCARVGENSSDLPDGMNDKISSVKVFGNTEVTVFKDVRFAGDQTRFDFDVRNLKNEGWNDRISSFRVRSTGGYRSGGGNNNGGGYGRQQNPDAIVRRAYQDILGRDPDQAGLRQYRSKIIDDGWTEQDVRADLRKSPEYVDKNTMTYPKAQEIVRRAYMNVLRREPDGGASGYVDRVIRNHWTQQDVERELRKSPEYRNKG